MLEVKIQSHRIEYVDLTHVFKNGVYEGFMGSMRIHGHDSNSYNIKNMAI